MLLFPYFLYLPNWIWTFSSTVAILVSPPWCRQNSFISEILQFVFKINEKEDQHRQELSNVTSQLDQVSFELSQLRKTSSESEEKSKVQLAKLERELSCMREGQQQLTDVSHELAQLRKVHADYKTKTDTKVANLKALISSHLPFIDSSKWILFHNNFTNITIIK